MKKLFVVFLCAVVLPLSVSAQTAPVFNGDKDQYIQSLLQYISQLTAQIDILRQGTSTPSTKTISLTAPNGGEAWDIGTMNTVTWTPYGYNPDINPSRDVTAYLEKKETNGSFTVLGKVQESGKASIHWTAGELNSATQGGVFAPPGEYYIRVVNNTTGATDRSDRPFKLMPRTVDLKINGSDGPVTVLAGQAVAATWSTAKTKSCELFNAYTDTSLTQQVGAVPLSGTKQVYVSNNEYATSPVLYCLTESGTSLYDTVSVTQRSPSAGQSIVLVGTPNGGESVVVGNEALITYKQQEVSTISVALYKNDQWFKWIVKDQVIDVLNSGKGEHQLTWKPVTADVAKADVGKAIYKIYITGKKTDGTGSVDDKSDAPFSLTTGTPVGALITVKTTPSPLTVSVGFKNEMCNGNWYQLNYGDGTVEDLGGCSLPDAIKNGIPPHEHTYKKAGTYKVSLLEQKGAIGGGYTVVSSVPITVAEPVVTLASCVVGEKTIPHGGSITLYATSTVPFGTACTKIAQSRKCTNGILSGDVSYTQTSCVVAAKPAPLPSCKLASNKANYAFGEEILFSWVATNATYAVFVPDTSGKDFLQVPGDKLPTKGTQKIKANVFGNPSVTLAVYNKDGAQATCVKSVTVKPLVTPTNATTTYMEANAELNNQLANVLSALEVLLIDLLPQ